MENTVVEPLTFPHSVRDALNSLGDQCFDICAAFAGLERSFHVHGLCTGLEPLDPTMLPWHACLGAIVQASVVVAFKAEPRILGMADVVTVQAWAVVILAANGMNAEGGPIRTAFKWRIPESNR